MPSLTFDAGRRNPLGKASLNIRLEREKKVMLNIASDAFRAELSKKRG